MSRNIAASVHKRLLNKARAEFRPFNELFQRYVNERFLYRLSRTNYADAFVLKGALMLGTWGAPESRPTMDVDLLGRVDNSIASIVAILKTVCEEEVIRDGLHFDPQSVAAVRFIEGAEYEGVRARVRGNLGNAQFALQIDIGFGDVVTPGPVEVKIPALLEFPPPELKGYTIESTIAEKLQAMVKLGELNSRMKDFYDLHLFASSVDFTGEILSEAIQKTFTARNTAIPEDLETLIRRLALDKSKQLQWRGFLQKARLKNAPVEFADVLASIRDFLEPVISSLAHGKELQGRWKAPGPWNE